MENEKQPESKSVMKKRHQYELKVGKYNAHTIDLHLFSNMN